MSAAHLVLPRRVTAPTTSGQALAAGLCLLGGTLAITVGGGFLTKALMPGASGTTRALVVLVVLTALVLAVRPRFGTWPALGVSARSSWQGRGLLALLLVLALTPLVFGVRSLAAGAWTVLLLAYALTGFTEELLWRGIALRVLEPLGPGRGALVGSALFGLAHLGNLLYRDNVALVAAQAWGAFCFGLGYAAVRRRSGTIVPLMGLHLLTDLCAAVTAGPNILLLVAQDVVLLILGAVLLVRGSRAARPHADGGSTRDLSGRSTSSLG